MLLLEEGGFLVGFLLLNHNLIVLSIVLSIIIVVVAAFTSIDLVGKMAHQEQYFKRKLWLIIASVTSGLGIWSMHFISMLGFEHTSSHQHYEYSVVFITIVLSILTAAITLVLLGHSQNNNKKRMMISVIFAFGISLVHYIGMFSMLDSVIINGWIIGTAFLIGAILAYFAFHVMERIVQVDGDSHSNKMRAALLLASSSLTIHYLGMYPFVDVTTMFTPRETGNRENVILIYWITTSIFILFTFIIVTAVLDRKAVLHAKKMSDLQASSLYEKNPNLVCSLNKIGELIKVNQAFIDRTGYKKDELINLMFSSLFEQSAQDEVNAAVLEASSGFVRVYSGNMRGKNGKRLQLHVTQLPILYNGRFMGINVIANDVTEQEMVKSQLLISEQTLKSTTQNIAGFSVKFKKVNGEFIHTYFHGELTKRLGLKTEEVVGKALREFASDELDEIKTPYYEKAWQGHAVQYEGDFNGVSYFMSLKPCIEAGEVTEVVGTAIDITDKNSIDNKFRENEELYRSILTTMTEGVIVIDVSGKIITVNEKATLLLQLPYDDFIQMNLLEETHHFVKENEEPLSAAEYPWLRTLQTEVGEHNQIIGFKRDSEMSWFALNTECLYQDDRQKGVIVTFLDITTEREQHQKTIEKKAYLENLIENDPTGILVFDQHGTIVLLNQLFCKMFHLSGQMDQLVGENVLEAIPNYQDSFVDPEAFKQEMESIVEEKTPRKFEEIQLKDGRVLLRDYVPIAIDYQLDVHLWKFSDITDKKQLQLSLRQALEGAQEGTKAKIDFLSNVSHELRTPLNSILGFTQLLEMEIDPELSRSQFDKVQRIKRSGDHLLQLINDMLELTRLDKSMTNLKFETVELHSFVHKTLEMMSPHIDAKRITLINRTPKGSTFEITADPVRLSQVFLNLLMNAVKYNVPGGEIRIEIIEYGGYYTTEFEDTGIGIAIEDQAKIFDHFYRTERVKHEFEGTGIGLSLAKQLVDSMGGSIGVRSAEGVGSCFYVSFPEKRK
ncbi:PAS domain S-box protein [Bacillus sp. FJAT-45037]|uniref:PAS domain S-box protein n=1 Tax=Bacillus sp. FJAT-45037 TaxID=2011007 RepID=UPI000C24973D|nr:PAS domain S-box protein [Bacillus sp. FJAT-45037]